MPRTANPNKDAIEALRAEGKTALTTFKDNDKAVRKAESEKVKQIKAIERLNTKLAKLDAPAIPLPEGAAPAAAPAKAPRAAKAAAAPVAETPAKKPGRPAKAAAVPASSTAKSKAAAAPAKKPGRPAKAKDELVFD